MPASDQDTNVQRIQDHSEEQYTRRDQMYQDGRLAGLAYHLLMLSRAASGAVDLKAAQAQNHEQLVALAGVSEAMKNTAAFPAQRTGVVSTEHVSQIVAGETSETVLDKSLRQIGESMTQEISRVVMDAMAEIGSVIAGSVGGTGEVEADAG